MITLLGADNDISVLIEKPESNSKIYVTLKDNHCSPGEDRTSYTLSVRYDDNSPTKDKFDNFTDAFDSFSNIVHMLTKEVLPCN